MDAITLNAVINDDNQLIVDLPADLPKGPVRLTIEPINAPLIEEAELTLEEIRARLAAGGALATYLDIPDDIGEATEEALEELDKLITIPLHMDALIDEERGEY